MCRHRHNRARTITHQYIVRNKNRNLFLIDRIHRTEPVKHHAGLFLRQFGALKVRLLCRLFPVAFHIAPVFNLLFIFVQNRMLRRNYHISRSEKGIASCGINPQFILFSGNGKVHFRPFGFSDPVFLGYGDLLHIVHALKPFDQLFRIICDLQHPLALDFPHNLGAASLTYAVYHFLIGKSYLTGSTPVDRHLRLIGKSFFKKL